MVHPLSARECLVSFLFCMCVLQLPYRSLLFDAALCTAVLHHMSTPKHRSLTTIPQSSCVRPPFADELLFLLSTWCLCRVQALRELSRILRVGGLLDIQVWALEQEHGSRRR